MSLVGLFMHDLISCDYRLVTRAVFCELRTNRRSLLSFSEIFCGIAKHFEMFDCDLFVITFVKIIGGILKSPTMTPAIKFESQPAIRPISCDFILEQT